MSLFRSRDYILFRNLLDIIFVNEVLVLIQKELNFGTKEVAEAFIFLSGFSRSALRFIQMLVHPGVIWRADRVEDLKSLAYRKGAGFSVFQGSCKNPTIFHGDLSSRGPAIMENSPRPFWNSANDISYLLIIFLVEESDRVMHIYL